MEDSKGKIGIKEFIAIIILSIGTKLTDDTTVILYKQIENAAWMSPFVIGALSIIPIYLLIKVLNIYESKNLADVINHLFGRFIGFFILMILWLILFSALTIDSAVYTDIISTMYFDKTPAIMIYALLMFVSAFGAKKGIEHIGSVAWSVIFWIKFSLLAALILTLMQGEYLFLFPIFGNGVWDIVKESSYRTSINADFLYLGLIYPYLKSKKDFKKGTWIALLFIVTEVSISLAAFVMLFDYKGIQMMDFPFHETIRYIQVGFLENIETFFFPFWLIASFIRFSFYLYMVAILFGSLFTIKNFEHLLPIIATLVVFLGIIPENPTFTIFNLRENLLFITTPIFIFLPCLLWAAAKFKGDFKHEKTKASN
ncbi:GerAB/ArcD/ProY family transporter [Cytobacillus massiliigabonensis]|uniref:GerAB/ArcD/ProY family transporter n=1 Tax=Cytobacillus massiliigabonensis TaxID=1871011 RepID=UPI0015E07DFE|nr:GerAB/ArcD/ProY family transporter [Cytobacillus massiliigabonensis]